METIPQDPQTPDREKIALLEHLRDCLGREKKCLLDLDVAELWNVMEEKQTILEAIESLPADQGPHSRIAELKEEIRQRARENSEFIQSSLAIFDELIFRIVGSGKDDHTYRPPGAPPRAQQGSIYRRKA
ncbi:MAG: flagellar protein FlgN [Deltaproteobacteria bacterium]|nr:flagellar protein FlgN [Deltaproteobacteria bacterium]